MTDREREFAAMGWDAAVAAMKYEDGTPVEIVSMVNPYRLMAVVSGTTNHPTGSAT